MMENKQVMVKLTVKDQPDLFTDLMLALQDLKLQVQQANIRTCGAEIRHIFAAAKVRNILKLLRDHQGDIQSFFLVCLIRSDIHKIIIRCSFRFFLGPESISFIPVLSC
jgi:hypothetical protein